MIVRFLSHKKSIFNSQRSSRGYCESCVTVTSLSFGGCWREQKFVIFSGAMITAQAWTQSCLTDPSNLIALSMIFLYLSDELYNCLNSTLSSRASLIFIQGFDGMSLAISFISEKGSHSALQISLTAALAAIVQNVHICATWSFQYLFLTYSRTLHLHSSEKSTSISGIETLAGFKNLSKSREYLSGSISVIHDR